MHKQDNSGATAIEYGLIAGRHMRWYERISFGKCLMAAAMFIGVQALVLFIMGRPLICTCGTIKLWVGIANGPENSQQLTDWYTFTHIIHGIGLYFLFWLIAPGMPVGLRFALAVGLEAGWEMVENSPFIIARYRQSALAQGYVGDSIINSISDTLSAVFGFTLARALPAWSSVVLVIAMELFVGYMIHDNLTLNIIQLIYPNEAISRWQVGG